MVALSGEGAAGGCGPVGPAVGAEGESPVVAVCDAVVASAQQHEVRQCRSAAVFPGGDVVGVAVAWWSVAAGVGAAAVACV